MSCCNSNTPNTNCKQYIYYSKPILTGFKKFIGLRNRFLITFIKALIHIKTFKDRHQTHT